MIFKVIFNLNDSLILRPYEVNRGNATWPSVNLYVHGAGLLKMTGDLFDSQKKFISSP